MEYNFSEIEKKWQAEWEKNETYKVSNKSDKQPFYVLDMFPYPSGAGLHVGHPLGYIASDIKAFETFVAAVDVAGNIAERVSHVKACARWIREHVEHVERLFITLVADFVGLIFLPLCLPLFLYFRKVVFHKTKFCAQNYCFFGIYARICIKLYKNNPKKTLGNKAKRKRK